MHREDHDGSSSALVLGDGVDAAARFERLDPREETVQRGTALLFVGARQVEELPHRRLPRAVPAGGPQRDFQPRLLDEPRQEAGQFHRPCSRATARFARTPRRVACAAPPVDECLGIARGRTAQVLAQVRRHERPASPVRLGVAALGRATAASSSVLAARVGQTHPQHLRVADGEERRSEDRRQGDVIPRIVDHVSSARRSRTGSSSSSDPPAPKEGGDPLLAQRIEELLRMRLAPQEDRHVLPARRALAASRASATPARSSQDQPLQAQGREARLQAHRLDRRRGLLQR